METFFQVKRDEALQAYQKADNKTKTLLKSLFGEALTEKVTDKVKSFEDACGVLGIKPDEVLHAAHSEFLKKDIVSINAYCKLIVIARALNEGWEPDWNNDDETKYYPWFYMSASGFRLASSAGTMRVRLSAPAFASARKNWLNTQRSSSNQFIKNYLLCKQQLWQLKQNRKRKQRSQPNRWTRT